MGVSVRVLFTFAICEFVEEYRQFAVTDDFDEAHHLRESPIRYHADRAEAVIALGELDRAEALVSRLEERARALPRPWILAVSARCRGLLRSARGDQDAALASLLESIAHYKRLDIPIERARALYNHCPRQCCH